MSVLALTLALALAAADPAPGAAANPVEAFLRAADQNDTAGMQAVLDRGSSRIVDTVKGCYLRRVYSGPAGAALMATWMCALGPNRSRVVVANVGVNRQQKVVVAVGMDQTNDRPAPERTGSAFAE